MTEANSNGKASWKDGALRYVIQPLIAVLLGLLAFLGGEIVKSQDGLHAEYAAMMKEEDANAQRLATLEGRFNDLKERFDRHEATTK